MWFGLLLVGPAFACEAQEPGCEQVGLQVVLVSLAAMGLGFVLLFVMDRVRYGRVGFKPIVNVKLGVNLVCLLVLVAMVTQAITFSLGPFNLLIGFWFLANVILGTALFVLRWRGPGKMLDEGSSPAGLDDGRELPADAPDLEGRL